VLKMTVYGSRNLPRSRFYFLNKFKFVIYALFRVCVLNLSTITNKFEKYQRNIMHINEDPYRSVPGIRNRERLRSIYIYIYMWIHVNHSFLLPSFVLCLAHSIIQSIKNERVSRFVISRFFSFQHMPLVIINRKKANENSFCYDSDN
jgi:hypothetical protein